MFCRLMAAEKQPELFLSCCVDRRSESYSRITLCLYYHCLVIGPLERREECRRTPSSVMWRYPLRRSGSLEAIRT